MGELKLRELYCEANPLLPMVPVPAEQQEEVLSLRVRPGGKRERERKREGEREGGANRGRLQARQPLETVTLLLSFLLQEIAARFLAKELRNK